METQNTTPPLVAPRRILVIRRNRIGDMVCSLPLLHALRRHFPQAHITVACDETGSPVARACPAVDSVYLLGRGFFGSLWNAIRLRGYDVAIAVKGGFDPRIARITQFTGAPIRIGFQADRHNKKHYTHPLPMPPEDEHQIFTCLRLLEPLGVTDQTIDFSLRFPPETVEFADAVLAGYQSTPHAFLAVVNISSNRRYPISDEQLATLVRRLAMERHALVALSRVPTGAERARAERIRLAANHPNIFCLETSTPLHLTAVLDRAALLITSEGGPGHLATVTGTPTVILWGEGAYDKWKTYAENHHYLRFDLPRTAPMEEELWTLIAKVIPPS